MRSSVPFAYLGGVGPKRVFSVLEIYFKITISQITYAFTPSYNNAFPIYDIIDTRVVLFFVLGKRLSEIGEPQTHQCRESIP